MNYLQKWWEEKYPNAGVEKIVNASEGIISIEDIIDFEQWIVKKLTLTDVVSTYCDCDKYHDRYEEANNNCNSCDKPLN
jgi:hypothetical protein